MLKLTNEQQKNILKELLKGDMDDRGNARMVFRLNKKENAEVFNFVPELDRELEYVIKVAIGFGGFQQNRQEYETFMNEKDAPLAEIFAYSQFIVIAEKVEVEEDFDLADYVTEDNSSEPREAAIEYMEWNDYTYSCESDYQDDVERFAQKIACIAQLHSMFGETGDNGQIGYSKRQKRYVAYDYGYNVKDRVDNQTSNLACETEDKDFFDEYLGQVIEIIDCDEQDEDKVDMLVSFENNAVRERGWC